MSEKIIKNWMALAEYDIKTAEAMLSAKRYIYVAFMCQQTTEKICKAIYVKETQQTPPYTHNLTRLAELISASNKMSSLQKDFLDRLNYFYLESRYSENLTELYKSVGEKEAVQLYKETKELYQWLLNLMK